MVCFSHFRENQIVDEKEEDVKHEEKDELDEKQSETELAMAIASEFDKLNELLMMEELKAGGDDVFTESKLKEEGKEENARETVEDEEQQHTDEDNGEQNDVVSFFEGIIRGDENPREEGKISVLFPDYALNDSNVEKLQIDDVEKVTKNKNKTKGREGNS